MGVEQRDHSRIVEIVLFKPHAIPDLLCPYSRKLFLSGTCAGRGN
jgi:hypothetical protein